MQEEALGLSATQVKEINRHLIELGLVTMKDSPNGKRYGRRHEKTEHIIEAYGFDLSPVAARHGEYLHLAEEERAERAAMGRLRRWAPEQPPAAPWLAPAGLLRRRALYTISTPIIDDAARQERPRRQPQRRPMPKSRWQCRERKPHGCARRPILSAAVR
jgi:Replication protein C N-terminal domain